MSRLDSMIRRLVGSRSWELLGVLSLAAITLAVVMACSAGHGSATPQHAGSASPEAASKSSQGWALTVYYTAVQSYHSGPPQQVRGCLQLKCAHGQDDLGTYPGDFVKAVLDEGTGRITSGPYTGRFLNWSIESGYWLDTAPRDARGGVLVPWVSAAADPSIPYGTRFKVLDCGVDDTTRKAGDVPASTCAKIRSASWQVADRFTSPNVGKHFDLYIGEEDRVGFVNSPLMISTVAGTISLL